MIVINIYDAAKFPELLIGHFRMTFCSSQDVTRYFSLILQLYQCDVTV
jgi:hypothetical protein